jgi:hypothetical protein
MSQRLVLEIHHKCDIIIEALGHNHVRVRITETNPELLNPTDFEIEGDPQYIWDAFTTAALFLANLEEISGSNPS